MYRCRFILLIIFISTISNAQQVILSSAKVHELYNQGEAYFNNNDFEHAIPVLEEIQVLYKKRGKISEYLKCEEMLCVSYENLAMYDKAIETKLDGINIRHTMMISDEDLDYAMQLGTLAHLYGIIGNYKEAINYSISSLKLKKKILGDDNEHVITSLLNTAHYYVLIGDYENAVSYIKEVETIQNSSNNVTILNMMASICSRLMMYDEALELQNRCVNILERDKESKDYYVALQNLALYNSYCNNIDLAIDYGEKSLRIQEYLGNKKTPYYSIGLNNLCYYYIRNKSYEKAINIAQDALNLNSELYVKNHENKINTEINLAWLYSEMNDVSKSFFYIEKVTEDYRQLILEKFKTLTKWERQYYWIKTRNWFLYQLPEYAIKYKSSKTTESLYDGVLLSKGLLLDSERSIADFVVSQGDNNIRNIYKDYIYLRTQADSSGISHVLKDSITEVLKQKENELLILCNESGDYTKRFKIHWDDIKQKLKSNELAVEFVKADSCYLALIISSELQSPQMIEININKDFKYLNIYEQSNIIWKPIFDRFNDKSKVYFSPDGVLYNIPIESLPEPSSSKLLSDRYDFLRLSSTRELVNIQNTLTYPYDVFLFGGISYDASDLYVTEGQTNDKVDLAISIDFTKIRGSLGSLQYLPGSLDEVISVSKLFASTISNENLHLFTEDKGRESIIKNIKLKNPFILHIATHGFFYSETDTTDYYQLSPVLNNEEGNNKSYEENVLAHSGLFLAGAQTSLDNENTKNYDNGILTSQEISLLDLRGLDLVTLSACETGLGDVTSDGVFGLQRGFKKAGVNSILMSLWKVDDEATCKLMTEFYSNWIAKKMTKHDALEAAKKNVRETKGWEDPKYWAAFILLDAID